MIATPPIARLTLRSESSAMRNPASSVSSCSTNRTAVSSLGLCSSIGGDQWSEVAAILNRVNNWLRLCSNVVRLDSTGVEEAGCLRISEHFFTPRQECSGAEHFSRMTASAIWMLTVLWVDSRGGEPATTFEVVTHVGHQAREYWLQHRRGQFEGESRLAADGNSQQSAVVAVRLAAGVL